MTPRAEVCVDAGLAVKAVVDEPDSDRVDALFAEWAMAHTQAPKGKPDADVMEDG